MKTKSPLFRIDRLLVAFTTAAFLAAVSHAQAQTTTNTWQGSSGGAWRTAGNWSAGVTPTSTAVARFTNSTTGGSGINGSQAFTNAVAGILLVSNGPVTISNSSTGNNVTNSNSVLRISGWVESGQTNLIVNESTSGHLILRNHSSATATLGVLRLQLASSGVINVSNAGAQVSILGVIQQDAGENFGFTKTGEGTLTIGGTNANTYSGLTTLSAGVLRFDKSPGTNVSGGDILVSGGSLVLANANQMANGTALTNTGGTIDFGGFTDTIGSYVQSGGIFTNGTLTASTYALNGGTVWGSLGTGTINVGGAVSLNGTAAATTVNLNSGGTLTLGSANRLADGAAVTIGGGTLAMSTFSDTVGSFTITSGTLGGSGTLTAASYALQGGTINAVLGAGAVTVSSGTTALGSAGRLNSASALTVDSGQLTLGGNETVASLAGSGGTVALGANTLTVGGGNTSTTFGGGISGTGGGLTKTGTGALTLAANTSYTGATTVNGGTLVYNGTNTGTAVTVNSGATLAGGGSVGATTINSGGTMNPGNSPGTQTYASLTWEGGANYNWQLYDADGVAGTDYDTFVSTGAFTINATSGNKFNINLWTLSSISPSDVNGAAVDFLGTSNYTWTLGTFSSISGFSADAFSINTFATNGTGGFANPFTGTFSINTNSTSLLLVYTAPVLGDEFDWSGGSAAWTNAASWTNNAAPPATGAKIYYSGAGGLSTNNVATAINGLTFRSGAGAYTVTGDALSLGNLGIVNLSTATQTVNLGLTLLADQSFNAANGELAFGGTVDLDTFTLTVTGTEDTTMSGAISGAGGLVKTGLGVLTLDGANTYSGGTLISAGGLFGTTTSLQGGITNLFLLAFSQSTNGTYAGVITGSGAVVKAGTGNVTFSGANDYEGGTLVDEGTLTGSTSSVPGDVEVSSGATFAISQATNGTFSGLIEGAGRFVKDGSGDVTLSGANTYSGGTLVSAGTLTGTASSLQGSITNNAAVVFVQTPNGTYGGAMSGSGSLTKSGTGTLTLSGANSYSGGTVVSSGTLAGTTDSLQGDINNSGTVRFDQTTTGSYDGELSGSGALVKAGSGAVTLAGENTYGGATTVEAGSLIAANNNSLSSSAVTMSGGSVLAEDGVELANNFTIGTAAVVGSTQTLQAWDLTGISSPATAAATFVATGLDTDSAFNTLTRGAGAAASSASSSFRTTGFQNNGINLNNTDYFEWSLSSTANDFSLGTLDARFAGTSSFAASPGVTAQFAYSINGGSFTLIDSPFITIGSPVAMPQIDLTGVSALQNLAAGTEVTFRYFASGQTTTGGWGFNSPGAGTNALEIQGSLITPGTGTGTLGISEVGGSATFSGGVTVNNTATFTAASGGQATFSGVVSGPGTAGITKTGAGTVTLSGASANTFTGMTTVSAGTLQLDKTAGTDALAGDVTVNSGAFLLISQSNQVNSNSDVSLSGGTITRGSGVSEVFGNLNLTAASFLDFGSGATGTISFGTYTPSALIALNIVNFTQGNTLTFGSNLTSSIETSAFAFSGNGGLGSYSWDNDSSTFTITAIPEPSTYAAAAGLLSLMLWPSRKRLLKDAKKILGFTPPMRDRLAAKRA
jgi:fibronectin-binding autotransporter adhesin